LKKEVEKLQIETAKIEGIKSKQTDLEKAIVLNKTEAKVRIDHCED